MRFHVQPSNDEKSHGQSLIELALMFPVMILILVGALDLGRVFYAYITVTNAAREGAAYGAKHPNSIGTDCTTPDTVMYRVCQEADGSGFPISKDNIAITTSPDSKSGSTITVKVHTNFQLIIGAPIGLDAIPLQTIVQMVII